MLLSYAPGSLWGEDTIYQEAAGPGAMLMVHPGHADGACPVDVNAEPEDYMKV